MPPSSSKGHRFFSHVYEQTLEGLKKRVKQLATEGAAAVSESIKTAATAEETEVLQGDVGAGLGV